MKYPFGENCVEDIRKLIHGSEEVRRKTTICLVLNRQSSLPDIAGNAKVKLLLRAMGERKANDLIERFRETGCKVEVFDGDLHFIQTIFEHPPTITAGKPFMVYQAGTSGGGPAHRALMPTFCNLFEIPVMNSDAMSRALIWHKYHSTTVLAQAGISVPDTWMFSAKSGWHMEQRPPEGLKVIAKSTYEAYAVGVDESSANIYTPDLDAELAQRSEDLGQPITIQEFIPGDEVFVPVLDIHGGYALAPQFLMVNDVPITGEKFLKFDDNIYPNCYTFTSYEACSDVMSEQCKSNAVKAFRALGMRGIGRMDFRVTPSGKTYLFDAAEVPGLSRQHAFNQAFIEEGFDEAELIPAMVSINLAIHGFLPT